MGDITIDSLFGSKTRVKLLRLFLSNPGKSFYVREITRLIDEQINSVRRELANMLNVGIITSDTADNKLYYQVDERYEYYAPLRAIFSDNDQPAVVASGHTQDWQGVITALPGIKLALGAGVLVRGSVSPIDILLVGEMTPTRAKKAVQDIEKSEGRELHYSVLGYDEFQYRLSVRDKFITEILNGKHVVLVDTDRILTKAT